MQTFGGVPASLMVVANEFRNAPLLCCWHEVQQTIGFIGSQFVHCASAVRGRGGFSEACRGDEAEEEVLQKMARAAGVHEGVARLRRARTTAEGGARRAS